MANNISEVIDFLSVARDAYTRGFDGCKKDYDKELQEIKRDFNPNTSRYVEEKEKAKARYESNLEKLKTEASLTGLGMASAPVWSGAPALYRGVRMSADI